MILILQIILISTIYISLHSDGPSLTFTPVLLAPRAIRIYSAITTACLLRDAALSQKRMDKCPASLLTKQHTPPPRAAFMMPRYPKKSELIYQHQFSAYILTKQHAPPPAYFKMPPCLRSQSANTNFPASLLTKQHVSSLPAPFKIPQYHKEPSWLPLVPATACLLQDASLYQKPCV